MLSTPSPPAGSRALAANAFRKAGLMDSDTRMRDATHDGRKGGGKAHRLRTSSRPRAVNAILGKDQPSSSNKDPRVVARIAASAASEGLSIRGASKAAATALGVRISRRADTMRTPPIVRQPQMVKLWKEFVERRWNKDLKFVDLSNTQEDEFLKQHGMSPIGSKETFSRENAVIFKLISQLDPQPQTLSLANNKITSGNPLSALSHYLPDLQNLSLENNSLKMWRDLDCIAGRKSKLTKLRELILTGNPVRELEYQNGRGDRYKSEMARRFPSLEMLDQEPIQKITFDVPPAESSSKSIPQSAAPTTFPNEMGSSFVTGVPGTIVSDFLMRFFPTFDNQRQTLIDVYHPSATFSFSANTSIPARARLQGYHHSKEMPNQKKLEWAPWLNGGLHGSRNLSRIAQSNMDKVAKSLHIGNEQIIKAICDLPKTLHDIVGAPDKFCVDAWPVVHGDTTNLFISMHGQFSELPSEGIRSFDRSFVLAPAPEGSRAKLGGWNVMILSDQFTVRAYSSHEAWKPGPMKVSAGDKTGSGPKSLSSWLSSLNPQLQAQLQEAVASIPEPQRTQVLEVCQRTGLNVQFSVDCLQGNNWDFGQAVSNFEQVKATLPREAFL